MQLLTAQDVRETASETRRQLWIRGQFRPPLRQPWLHSKTKAVYHHPTSTSSNQQLSTRHYQLFHTSTNKLCHTTRCNLFHCSQRRQYSTSRSKLSSSLRTRLYLITRNRQQQTNVNNWNHTMCSQQTSKLHNYYRICNNII